MQERQKDSRTLELEPDALVDISGLPEINFHQEALVDKKLLIEFLLAHNIDFDYLPYTKAYLQTIIRINHIPHKDDEHRSYSTLPRHKTSEKTTSRSKSRENSLEKMNIAYSTLDSAKFNRKKVDLLRSKKTVGSSPDDSHTRSFGKDKKKKDGFNKLKKTKKLQSSDVLSRNQESNTPSKTSYEARSLKITPPKESPEATRNKRKDKGLIKSKHHPNSVKKNVKTVASTADSSKSYRSSDSNSSRSSPYRSGRKLYGSKKITMGIQRPNREEESEGNSFNRRPILESEEEDAGGNLPITPNLSIRSSLEQLGNTKKSVRFDSFGDSTEKTHTTQMKYANQDDPESKVMLTGASKHTASNEEHNNRQDGLEIKKNLLNYLSSLLSDDQNDEAVSHSTKGTKSDDNIKIEDMSKTGYGLNNANKKTGIHPKDHQTQNFNYQEAQGSLDSKSARELILGSFLTESEKNISFNRRAKNSRAKKTGLDGNANKMNEREHILADPELKGFDSKGEHSSRINNNGRNYLLTLRARYGNKYLNAHERISFSPKRRQSHKAGSQTSPDHRSNLNTPSGKMQNNATNIRENEIMTWSRRNRIDDYSTKISPDKFINRMLAIEVEKRSKNLLLGKFDTLTTQDLALYYTFLLEKAKKQFLEHIRTNRILKKSPSRSPDPFTTDHAGHNSIGSENVSKNASKYLPTAKARDQYFEES